MEKTFIEDDSKRIEKWFEFLQEIIAQEDARAARMDNAPLGTLIDASGRINEFYKRLDEMKEALGGVLGRYKNGMIPKQVLNMAVTQELSFDAVKTQKAEEFRATVSPRYSVTMLDADDGIKWLKDNGQKDLVKETVNPQTLGKLAQELEQKAEELPDDTFKVNKSFSTTLTRHKPKL